MRVGIAVFLACVSLLTASIASAQFPTVLSVKTNATFINDVQPSSDTNTFTVTRQDTSAGSQGSITFQKCTISGSPVTGVTKVGNYKWNTFTDGDLSFLRFSFNFLIPDTTGNWGEFVLVNSNEFGRFARFWRPENEEAISTANGIVATESEDLPGDDWIINTTETSTHIFESNGTPILVNVQSAVMVTLNGVNFELVQATGIPNYVHTMTQEDVDTLNNRPNAATDFDNGETSAGVGQAVEFGEDIGYQPGSVGCGLGYWPRGP